MQTRRGNFVWGLLAHAFVLQLGAAELVLREGWQLQSADKTGATGQEISRSDYLAQNWYAVTLPATVIAGLLQNHVYENPFYAKNLEKIADTGCDNVTHMCADSEVPAASPFAKSWWYRREFHYDREAGKRTLLRFDGINYSANIWINGKKIADQADVLGTFRSFEFDVTSLLNSSASNVIAAEIFISHPKSLSSTWIDWVPWPADKNMGIYKDVSLKNVGDIELSSPYVSSVVSPDLKEARLTVGVRIKNLAASEVDAELAGKILGNEFKQALHLKAGEIRDVQISDADFSFLRVSNPQLWWPARMGKQTLNHLELSASENGLQSDQVASDFGIRQYSAALVDHPTGVFRQFYVNGKPVFVRGGGWSPDLFLRAQPNKEAQALRYVLDMGLNAVRFEGFVPTETFLKIADQSGILVMAGLACCSYWQNGDHWQKSDYPIATDSVRNILMDLRTHASVFAWLNGSDAAPPPALEQQYLDVEKEIHWPNQIVSAAGEFYALEGASGVKMRGPYDYEPPSYWSVDRNYGGAFGFMTESGPGVSIPPLESLTQFIPKDELWPLGGTWDYHAARGDFHDLSRHKDAIANRYGIATSLDDFLRKSNAMAYEDHRSMYEAYQQNKFRQASGLIHWMLNSAWPSMYWNLFDFYMRKGATYASVKKANEDLHVQYSYADHSVYVVNNLQGELSTVTVSAELYDFNMQLRFKKNVQLKLAADSSGFAFEIPEVGDLTTTYFLKLNAQATTDYQQNNSDNFYWLSTKKEVYDFDASDYIRTPVVSDGDLTELNNLPPTSVGIASQSEDENRYEVTLKNTGANLAFMLALKATDATTGEELITAEWQDNFFSLLPNEVRTIELKLPESRKISALTIEAKAWNVPATTNRND